MGSACSCSLDKCGSQVSACLADANCAASQACAAACACGDTSCSLTCAATSPSALALPVASCVNSNCQSLEAKVEEIDCSTFACPSACSCSLDKCGSQVSACLADENCAASQSCAAACACGDTSCSL